MQRKHQIGAFDLPSWLHLAEMTHDVRRKILLLQHVDDLGTYAIKQVTLPPDRVDIDVQRPRQSLLRHPALQRAKDHVVLLHSCKAIDPLVVGEAFIIVRDQTGKQVESELLGGMHSKMTIEHQIEPGFAFWSGHSDRFNDANFPD